MGAFSLAHHRVRVATAFDRPSTDDDFRRTARSARPSIRSRPINDPWTCKRLLRTL